jgi:hypothetical protein
VGRYVGGAFVVVLALAVLGLLGGVMWLRAYLRGPEFLATVNAKASAALQADVRVSEFRWDGMHARVPLVEVESADNMIRRIEGEEFETEVEVGALLRKQFRSTDFIGRSMIVELDVTKPAPVLPPPSEAFEFPGAKIESLSGVVDFGEKVVEWSGVRMEVQPGSAVRSYDVKMDRGTLVTPIKLFPKGKLRSGRARYFDRQLYLTEAEIGVYESGKLHLTGELSFDTKEYIFEGALRRVLCAEMVPEDWKKRLLGSLESDFTVRGKGKAAPVVQGSLNLRDGVLTALPVLDRLAAYSNTTRFRRLALSEARLDYRQEGKHLALTDVVLVSDGLTRLEGRLDVVDGQLNGVFEFGVVPGTLARIPGAETKVFLPGREGMLWTSFRVGGTLEDPKEDLSERMIAAAKERMFEMLPETGMLVLKNSGRAAGDLAKGILQKGGGVTDLGTDVVEEGVDVIKDGTNAVRNGVGGLFNLIPGVSVPERPPLPEPEEVVPVPEEVPEELEEDVRKELEPPAGDER